MNTKDVYIISEIGVNHNGNFAEAKFLIDESIKAGANAVKFQVRDLESIYTKKVLTDPLKAEHGTQYILSELQKSQLTYSEIRALYDYSNEQDIDFIATAFDIKSANFLNELGISTFKVGSPDLTNLPLLKHLAGFNKRLILSTGMSTEEEITQVVEYLKSESIDFTLLHCNSTYPASFQDINISYLQRLKEISNNNAGYSGHEQGFAPTLAAVALGAKVIERHITRDRDQEGPDHSSSLTPKEFKEMVTQIKTIQISLGINEKVFNQGEQNNRLSLGKSLVYKKALSIGHIITHDDFEAKTPAKGVSPLELEKVIGQKLNKNTEAEEYFSFDHINNYDNKYEDSFDIPTKWGIVGRLNDFKDFLHLKPKLVEIHLTWRDLVQFQPEKFVENNKSFEQDLVVHAPEYYYDELVDFSTNDSRVTDYSIEMLNKTIELTEQIAPYFKGIDPSKGPRIVLHPGGHFPKSTRSNKDEQYRYLHSNLKTVNSRETKILLENIPPYPWYHGGQWYNTIFMDSKEISDFSEKLNWGICYDLSHALLYCNSVGKTLETYTKEIIGCTKYLHISDGAGCTQEGLQLGEGDLNFDHLFEILSQHDIGFIPEIWKGHLDQGKGFKVALKKIEKLFINQTIESNAQFIKESEKFLIRNYE